SKAGKEDSPARAAHEVYRRFVHPSAGRRAASALVPLGAAGPVAEGAAGPGQKADQEAPGRLNDNGRRMRQMSRCFALLSFPDVPEAPLGGAVRTAPIAAGLYAYKLGDRGVNPDSFRALRPKKR